MKVKCGLSKSGCGLTRVQRRTARKRLRRSLKNFKVWVKEHRHLRLRDLVNRLNTKLRGYYNYFGVLGNARSLQQFFSRAIWLLWKQLNQRSQRKSYNWAGFREFIEHFKIERPRIVERPRTRLASGLA